jgi:hypothetical protein
MSAKKKRQDAFKAKEKKQKIIAAVGGVLLIGLLAFQVPRVMAQMNRGKGVQTAVPAVSTPAVGSTTPTLEAPTTLRGQESTTSSSGSTDSGASGSGSISQASGAAAQGQLASFSRFESKDPFSQQVQATAAASGSSSGTGSSGGTGSSAATGSSSGTGSGSKSGSATSTGTSGGSGSSSPGTQPAPGSAVISVNGTLLSVSVGTDFPQPTTADPNATPLFHLVSLTATTAKIAIAGGSYTSGASAVTLRVNKPVTLMNTADGSRFKLILKPQGTPVPGAGAASTTTPTVTLPAATP